MTLSRLSLLVDARTKLISCQSLSLHAKSETQDTNFSATTMIYLTKRMLSAGQLLYMYSSLLLVHCVVSVSQCKSALVSHSAVAGAPSSRVNEQSAPSAVSVTHCHYNSTSVSVRYLAINGSRIACIICITA